ncbi:cobalamin B12-binding domain-containing protein [Thermodesulfobacteriota bacterium]
MTKSTRKNRVLIAKPGLDGHDRGAKIIARALRDSEFEVIYTGIRQTPEAIASAAVQEDVAAIGLSSLSGAHLKLFPAVMEALKKADAGDIKILGGGIIPDEDIPLLKEAGITAVFTPGATLKEIVEAFRDACERE